MSLKAQARPADYALPSQAVAAVLPALGVHPLQSQLRDQVGHAGAQLIQHFVHGLDAAVQSLLAESRHAGETRALLDLGHSLAASRPALMRGFTAALKRRFDPLQRSAAKAVVDLERLSLLPLEEREEEQLLARLTERADEKAGEPGRQLSSRLQWASRHLALPALAAALSPATLPDCFAQAFRAAGLTTAERLLAYRLVESHAIHHWSALVHAALLTLDQQGFSVARSLSGNDAEGSTQDAGPAISAATLKTLREAASVTDVSADTALAQALLHAVEPPLGGRHAGLITTLAGMWMDGLLAEPELPMAFGADLESLRLAVIKAALCDPSFFLHPLHPVRKAVDELVQKAEFVGLQGYSLTSVRFELKEVFAHISIHGQFALDALSMLPPLESDLTARFQQQMLKDQTQRRENLLARVRTLATREVEARTLDVALPTAARAALARGFLPLLSALILRHGATAVPTRLARQLLERFVDSFALCVQREQRQTVLQELRSILLDVGLADLPIAEVCVELEKAYAELEAEMQTTLGGVDASGTLRQIDDILTGLGPVAETSQALSGPADLSRFIELLPVSKASQHLLSADPDVDPLDVLLKPGQWFRVRDYKRGDDRWLSLGQFSRAQDRVSFSGFDGATVLAMRAAQFIEDLATGLAEPLNPAPQIQQALFSLRAQRAVAASA